MSGQQFTTTDVLRLEVERAPVAGELLNLVQNPSGELGGWGWVTPQAGSSLSGNVTGLHYTPDSSAAVPDQWYTETYAATPGHYVAARWEAYVTGGSAAVLQSVQFLDSSFNVLSTTAEVSTGLVSAYTVGSMAATLIPASTAYVRFRFRILTGTAVAHARNVVMATATTSGALADLTGAQPVFYTDVLGPTHDIKVNRESLNVGVLTAAILDSTLDPSQSTAIRPGRKCRLTALGADSKWHPIFTGKVSEASVVYHLKDPDVPESKRARITLTAVDAIADLANTKRSEGVATVDDLPYVLEGCGVPWSCNYSGSQVPSATVVSINENASALDQVAITRDSDMRSIAWVDRQGVLNVQNSTSDSGLYSIYVPTSAYSDIDISYNTLDCINEVWVKFLRYNPSTGQTEEVPYGPYRDEASISEWGVRSAEFTIHGDAEETAGIPAYANAILAANATPEVSINSITVPIATTGDIFEFCFDGDLYAGVSVDHPDGVNWYYRTVTSVEHSITPDKWLVKFGFTGAGVVASPTQTPSPGNPEGQTIGELLRPVGEVTMFYGSTIPAGWLKCDGSAIPADYPDLIALIGPNTPNFTDRFPIGAGVKAVGTSGGASTKVIGTANLPPHSHTATTSSDGSHDHSVATTSSATGSNTARVARGTTTDSGDTAGPVQGGGTHDHSITVGNGPGSSTPLDVMNPWRAVNFIIRAI